MSETTTEANQHQTHEAKESPYLVPIAILIAGLLIAGAVLMRNGGGNAPVAATGQELTGQVLPVTDEDHIYGSRNADVFFIEYSDFRCSFCARFHSTILEILNKYEGRVAWVYRHTPYQPGGREAAIASECVADLVNEDAFWSYNERAMNNQRSLSPEWHQQTAVELGADQTEFQECIASGNYDELIREHTLNSQELGSQGTPYTVLLTRNGDTIKFAGAQPIENVTMFVERAIKSLE